ncbi:MAG: pyridoxamine 5'-phosphate oxidase family protein [Kineosporiaceae bacterium]
MDSALPDDMVELDARHCWERLRAAGMGRLAVVVDDAPEIFPVDHAVDDADGGPRILIRTAAGTKLFAADGRDVAFEVDGVETRADGEHAWSVVAKGVAETVRDADELARRAASSPQPRWRSVKPHLLAVHVTSVSGRSFPVDR